jgi:hypothetical protein
MATSVPNNTVFSLQDVIAVLGCAGNLTACFTYAVDSYFDAAYKGSKTNLLNFRNYTQPYISVSNNSCRFHYNQPPYDANVVTVSYAKGTYTYAWSTGSHFSYSKSGDAFTVTCNGNNTSGAPWSDTLTFTLSVGGLTATFSVVQFVSPN